MIGALWYYLVRGRKEWEDLCNRCGRCCYTKEVQPDGTVFIDYSSPCRYLNSETHLCTVYERRFKVCRECRKVTIFHALWARYMPRECAYVQFYRHGGYRRKGGNRGRGMDAAL